MRISTVQIQNQSIGSILDQQAQLSKTQQQLSSGRRILTPADDPSGASASLNLAEQISSTQQYQRNADAAKARLGVEENSLSSVVNVLQRVRDLAVQANNGSQNADNRKSVANEVSQLLDTLKSLANTKDANGEYIFAGFKSGQQPFSDSGSGTVTYSGDQGQRSLQIGPSRSVAVGDAGSDVFMNIPGTSKDAFSTLSDMVTNLQNNAPDPSTITTIDAVMKNVLRVQSSVGARLNAIDVQTSANSNAVLQMQTTKSNIDSLDIAKAISNLNLQMTSLQAAQQSYVKIQGLSLFNFL
jgi:flagellar hook-associated protein 3 FlgL